MIHEGTEIITVEAPRALMEKGALTDGGMEQQVGVAIGIYVTPR